MIWNKFATSGKSFKGWKEAEESSEKAREPRGNAITGGERRHLCGEYKRQSEEGHGEDGLLGINKMKGDAGSCFSDGSTSGWCRSGRKWMCSLLCLEIH